MSRIMLTMTTITAHNEQLKVCSKSFKCHKHVTVSLQHPVVAVTKLLSVVAGWCGGVGVVLQVTGTEDRVAASSEPSPWSRHIASASPVCCPAVSHYCQVSSRHQPTTLPYCHITTYPHILLTPHYSKYSFFLQPPSTEFFSFIILNVRNL